LVLVGINTVEHGNGCESSETIIKGSQSAWIKSLRSTRD
jgi:hypothetical protein